MRFPGSRQAAPLIEGMELQVPGGQIVALVGRSGIGKTTLLRIMAGLEHRFIGSVALDGVVVAKPSRRIQIMHQDFRLIPWKTVLQNVLFSVPNDATPSKLAQAREYLQDVGLGHRMDAWPRELSGGEQARTALGRLFMSPPAVLLLDEAFHNLDVLSRTEMRTRLLGLAASHGTTMIVVSHNIDDAIQMCDVVHVLTGSPMRIAQSIRLDRPRAVERATLGEIMGTIVTALEMTTG